MTLFHCQVLFPLFSTDFIVFFLFFVISPPTGDTSLSMYRLFPFHLVLGEFVLKQPPSHFRDDTVYRSSKLAHRVSFISVAFPPEIVMCFALQRFASLKRQFTASHSTARARFLDSNSFFPLNSFASSKLEQQVVSGECAFSPSTKMVFLQQHLSELCRQVVTSHLNDGILIPPKFFFCSSQPHALLIGQAVKKIRRPGSNRLSMPYLHSLR